MFPTAYFVWAILPLGLLILALVSTASRSKEGVDRGYVTDYLEQFAFTVVALVIAVLLDRMVYSLVEDFLDEYGMEPNVMRWLIYPIVLVLMANVNQMYKQSKDKADLKARQERKMKYAPKGF